MTFRIERDDAPRESFGEYRYLIYRGGTLIARYWHDYRGDEHGLEFLNGKIDMWPVGRMIDFLEGGGPQPIMLSKRAEAFIKERLA